MARSGNHSGSAVGCAALLVLAAVTLVCWLVWTAVMWVVAEWRWAWFAGYMLAVPALAWAIVRVWGEQRPFVPSRQLEAWITAALTAVAAAAPVVVLAKGWGTGTVALLLALGSASAVAYAAHHGVRSPGGEEPHTADDDAPSDAAMSRTK
ncbi:hypothetical protein AB0N17_01920 [Streptomyces sp. NPDC051133]|uniref:hypothetical protein n=1 Tax=Streptomyces sp. NPDC051133 TaxID=3155521 RepID=UPI003442217D